MEQFQAKVNNRTYTFDEYMSIPDNTIKVLKSNKFISNGCGTNGFNKFLIGMLESWAKVKLVKCCIVHDCNYELADGSIDAKIRIDAAFHINIYRMVRYNGGSVRRARVISRLFHMAVFYAGPTSYKYVDE